ncbi:PAS domain S-box protein [Thiohalocapsa halophila]|nr:PAS domain S-box protein [Thiohalocapsa halophila]
MLLETLLLAGLGVLGNVFSVSLFFGVEVLFGSIAALVAVARLGLLPGLAVAIAAGAYTLVLWDHPYALLIFALEALAVALHRRWAQRRGRPLPPLAISAALYWVLIGIPLVLVFYHGPLGMGWLPTLLIAAKQSLNGILNAALAGSLLLGLALLQGRRGLPRLSELLFSLLLAALLLPSLLVTAWENSDLKSLLEADRAHELRLLGALAVPQLAQAAAASPAQLAAELRRLNAAAERHTRLGAAPRLFLAERASGAVTLGEALPAGPIVPSAEPGLALVLPAQPQSSAMVRWRASRYRAALPVPGMEPPQDLIIEVSAVPVIDAVQQRITRLLAALLALALGAVLLAALLSRRIVGPIQSVADAARALPAAIRDGQPWSVPSPGLFAESAQLGHAVTAMGESLGESFEALQRERDEQVRQRALLDLEAHCLAWLVRHGDNAAAFADALCRQLQRVLPGQHCFMLPSANSRLELVASPGLPADAREDLVRRLAAPAAQVFLQRVLVACTPVAVPPEVMEAEGTPATDLCSGRAIPICDRTGSALGILLTDIPAAGLGTFSTDVFERVRPLAGLGLASIQLHREHHVLLEALSQSGTGIVVTRRSGRDHLVTYANRGFTEVSGYSAEALLGQDLRMLRDGDEDQLDLERLRAALAADQECSAVIRNRRPDGSTYWSALALSPVHGDGATVTHYIGVQQDVTETVESTARLRASEARLNEAQAIAHLGSWAYAMDGTGYWSDEAYRLLGYAPGAVASTLDHFLAVVHPDDRERVRARALAAQQPPYDDYDIEFRVCARDGVERMLLARGRMQRGADGTPQRFAGTALDVTEQRRIEAALREQQERYRLVVNNLEDLLVRVDTEGRFEFVSPSYCRMFGRSEAELLGQTFMPLVHPDDREATAEAMARLFAPPHAATMEQRAETVHGWRWLQWSDKAVLDAQGQVVAIVGVGRDITERKAAEQALRESEQRFRALFETIGEGVIYYDGDGVMTEANPVACAMLALPRDQVQGRRPESEPWQLLGEDGTPLAHAAYPSRVALRSGQDTEPMVVGLRAGDSVRWLLAKAHPETAPGAARPHRVFVTFADITSLLETQLRLQAIIDSSPHGIVELGLHDRRVLCCNTAMERLFGYPPGGLIGLGAEDLHPPGLEPQLVADLGMAADDADAGSLNVPLYVPCRRRDGGVFHCKIAPGLMQLGAVRTLTAFFTDVTLEYQSRNALEDSRQALLGAQALAHIGSWEYDIAADDLQWSPEVYRIFEQDPASFGASFDAFQTVVHPDDRESLRRAYAAATEHGAAHDLVHRLLLPDGRIKWVHERAAFEHAADGQAIRARGTVQDITERHLAQQRLRESRERLSAIFDNAPMGIALLDEQRRLLMVNRALAGLLGRSPDALRDTVLDSLIHPDDLPANQAQFSDLLTGRRTDYRLTERYLRPDGRVVWGDLRMALLPAGGDAPPTPLAMVEDVTELHEARERRRALEGKLSAYTARLEDLLDLVNQALPPEHQLQALLRLACRALDLTGAGVGTLRDDAHQPELIASIDTARGSASPASLAVPPALLDAARAQPGKPVVDCDLPADGAAAAGQDCHIALAFAGDDAPEAQREQLLLVLWGEQAELALDEPLWQLLRLVAQRIAAVRAQERLQHYLVQAKERETIGHLASGVAHDFNNLLGVLDINLLYIEDALAAVQDEDPELPQVLEETRSALGQAKVVASGMLSMSRAGGVPLALVPLDTTIGELAGILHHMLPAGIRLETAIPAGLAAWSNGAFLQAALLNLALNARDAMPDGGTLRITARSRRWDGCGALAVGDLAAGDYVELSVQDDGSGMTPETQASIFEPLFSTKAKRRGHGLGLFMVKEFVLRSGAGLAVESARGQGTRFRLLLPTQPSPDLTQEPMDNAPQTDSVAGLRVLVVDDDPRVRDGVARVLTRAGMTTRLAEHGELALERLRADPGVDLVLTDVAMPVLDGLALKERLAVERPGLPVLLMTGQYATPDRAGADADADAALPILRKPLEQAQLFAAIRTATPGGQPKVGPPSEDPRGSAAPTDAPA